MRRYVLMSGLLTGSIAFAPAYAQTAGTTPMVGWACRMLNLTEAQSMDFNTHIPFRAEPSETSPPIGYASATIAVRTPVKPVNGFVQAMFPTGQSVWIAADMIKPWHAASNPTATCLPVTKANGKPGFTYPQ